MEEGLKEGVPVLCIFLVPLWCQVLLILLQCEDFAEIFFGLSGMDGMTGSVAAAAVTTTTWLAGFPAYHLWLPVRLHGRLWVPQMLDML